MERETEFHRLKTVNELDADEIVANLLVEIEELEYEGAGHPDDYVIDEKICPVVRAAFLKRVVDLIEGGKK